MPIIYSGFAQLRNILFRNKERQKGTYLLFPIERFVATFRFAENSANGTTNLMLEQFVLYELVFLSRMRTAYAIYICS